MIKQYFHSIILVLLFTGAVQQVSAQALSGSYSIDASGAGNYTSFGAAVSALTTNGINGAVTFLVEPGTYNEQISISAISGASAINTIQFIGNASDSLSVVLSYNQTAFASNYVVHLDGADYVSFQKMTIQSNGFIYNRVVVLENQADYNIFSHCHIVGQPATSYYTDNAVIYSENTRDQHNQFLNNSILNGSYGIYLFSTSINDEYNNHIHGNFLSGFFAYGIKMEYQYAAEVTNNVLVSASQCYSYLYGVYLRYADGPTKITGNKIEVRGSDDIRGITTQYCNGTTLNPVLIANNFVMETGSSTNNSWGMFIYHGLHQHVYHNSVWVSSGSASGSRGMYFTTYGSTSTGYTKIKNNIVVNTAGGPAIHTSYSAYTNNLIAECDYNNWYTTGTYIGKYKDIGETSLADWQTETMWDAYSFNLDPLFVDTTNLHIGNLALNGTGTPLAEVAFDIDGEARDSINPDIGADEFGLPGPMNGSYLVDLNGSGDFLSFTDVINSLEFLGIDGSVVFNILPGTYLEKPVITEISGASGINTICFQSANGDSSSVILSNDIYSSCQNYTLYLNGADHIIFKNITIATNVVGTYCRLVGIDDGATHISFENCIFQGVAYYSNSTEFSLVFSDTGNDDYCSFINNRFSGGSNSLYLKGSSEFNPEVGLQVIGNEFLDFSYRGILTQYQENSLIEGNTIVSNPATSTYSYVYGIYATFWTGSNRITRNTIKVTGYDKNHGLFLNYCDGVSGSPVVVDNNMFSLTGPSTSSCYGIYSFSGNHQQIYFNSVLLACGNSGSAAFYATALSNGTYQNIDIQNNIFANINGGYASYINNTALTAGYISSCDYNNYYNTGGIMAKFGNFDAADLAAWQLMSGWGSHSVEGNPLFVADTVLHIQAGSPAIAGGNYLAGYAFDIDGELRDTVSPCIGADEFIVPVAEADTHLVALPLGWGIFSTYINPFEAMLDSVFAPVSSEVSIVKNGNGNVFWPQYGVNAIGNLVLGEGYQSKMNQALLLPVIGNAAVPENVIIPVPQGWSIIGYLRKTPAALTTMLSSINSEIIIMKDGDGSIYWPLYGINLIGDLQPGKGYQVKLANPANLTYPANL
ncbi:MAG: right-handed parallel beta-helix repeat-containing protein [Bacteroidales bacterium]|nr:right-handed parallel beta-helix repeat-containing protein [Bacteroidales bacterium]MCF8457496.1 right-handed parallel beta-helix repeat-containing protein [Bacteroidales bacterium]